MFDSDFPTTILTSKSPEEVANFISHSLQLSSRLIENNLLVWFANYAAMISRYNQDLNALVANGRDFFTGEGAEFGSLDKIWNCVATSVMSQIQVNEALAKVIKKDVLGQFQAAFKNDVKYSELLVNSEELLEMKSNLGDSNGAYNWNVKAPAILSNFENYKRFEKDSIFGAFIAYLNTVTTKTAGLVHKNENIVNFILKEYQLNNEMQLYTDYMINTDTPAATGKGHANNANNGSSQRPERPQRPSVAPVNSGSTSGTTSVKEKRKSKLRLKMSSILGRKKKTSSLNPSETIPEDASTAFVPSRQGTFASRTGTRENRNSMHNESSAVSGRRHSVSRNVPLPTNSGSMIPEMDAAKADICSPPPSSAQKNETFSKQSQPLQLAFDAPPLQPLRPSEPSHQALSEPTEIAGSAEFPSNDRSYTPRGPPISEWKDEDANFVKYSSSEDESDVPMDDTGKRLSLLNAHSLGQPPKVDAESDARSRNNSSAKYSFEYGDEAQEISTPQRTTTLKSGASPQFQPFTEDHHGPSIPESADGKTPLHAFGVPQSLSSSISSQDQKRNVFQQPPSTSRPAPPPPPSRKAHSASTDACRDSLQNMLNRHGSRDSTAHPFANDRMSLVSQTTGNSLMRQDQFKHFGAPEGVSKDGLNTSVAEIINATFRDGKLTKAQVLGEVAFNYNSSQPHDTLTIHIPTQFSKFLLNDQLMAKHGSDKYTLNLSHIAGRTLGGIKYLLDLNSESVPVLVKQIWKFEPQQASLIIKMSWNPAYNHTICLDALSVAASLDSSVTCESASSKPEGSFNKDLNRITWRYTEPLVLHAVSPEIKLIARIMTTSLAKESPAGTKLRFTISDGAVLNVKILDSALQPVPSITSLSSGNYSSHV